MLRVFEAFAGYGSQSIALRNLGIDYEVVAISEIDKYAIKAYEAIHGPTNNLGDICKIDPSDIPDHDLFTYSFPCQDLSMAGKQAGLGKGTRSGLLYECEKVIEAKKPKYLLLENVKNLVGKKFKPQFDEWLEYLEGLGYANYWQVLNAKDYGVPQNRERVFVVSILGEHEPYEFPKTMPLDKCIADILEDKVDEKYYINKPFHLVNKGHQAELDIKGMDCIKRFYGTDKVSPTLTTMQGGMREPKILCEGNVNPSGKGMSGNVFNSRGIAPTLTTNKGEGNKILEHKIYQKDKVRKYDVDIDELKKTLKDAKNKSGLTIKDIAHKLDVSKTTVEHWFRSDNCFSIPDENIWLGLKKLLGITTDKFDKSIMEFEIKPNEYNMSNRVYGANGISPTLTASGESGAKKIILPCICASRGRNPENPSDRTVGAPTEQRLEFNTKGTSNTITTVQKDNYIVETTCRIRKLTPRECFRLMGMREDDIDKIQAVGISNTQQYKMAGNSIVVNVLEAIFGELFGIKKKTNKY